MKKTLLWSAILGLGLLAGCSEGTNPEATAKKTDTHTENQTSSTVQSPVKSQASQQSTMEVKQNTVSQETKEKSVMPSSTGASLYARCVGCHGAAGEGGVGPKLKGQSQEALMTKIKGYRDGKQFGPMTSMMAPNVQGMSDEEIKKISAYIVSL